MQELKAKDRTLHEANLRLRRHQAALAAIQDKPSKVPDEQSKLANQPPGRIKGNTRRDVSDVSVRAFQRYALALTPPKFTTPGGTTIHVDKSKPGDIAIPVDAAREVVKVAYNSALAKLCELPDEQQANYQALMRREIARAKWTDQQLLYIKQLHQVTVLILTGSIVLVDDKDKSVIREAPRKDPLGECSEARRKLVQSQIAAYVNATSPPSAALTKHERDLLSGLSELRSP